VELTAVSLYFQKAGIYRIDAIAARTRRVVTARALVLKVGLGTVQLLVMLPCSLQRRLALLSGLVPTCGSLLRWFMVICGALSDAAVCKHDSTTVSCMLSPFRPCYLLCQMPGPVFEPRV
jgi:hypothetical protein